MSESGDGRNGSGEIQFTELEQQVVDALKTVYDPEIPVNIYELGLIYTMKVDEEARSAAIEMTLTSPGCPVAATFPDTVRMTVEGVDGIDFCSVELVWYPPWTPEMMTEAARLELGFF
jgi:FeS assembly SUF system protein